jgi:hypothetical protein
MLYVFWITTKINTRWYYIYKTQVEPKATVTILVYQYEKMGNPEKRENNKTFKAPSPR